MYWWEEISSWFQAQCTAEQVWKWRFPCPFCLSKSSSCRLTSRCQSLQGQSSAERTELSQFGREGEAKVQKELEKHKESPNYWKCFFFWLKDQIKGREKRYDPSNGNIIDVNTNNVKLCTSPLFIEFTVKVSKILFLIRINTPSGHSHTYKQSGPTQHD